MLSVIGLLRDVLVIYFMRPPLVGHSLHHHTSRKLPSRLIKAKSRERDFTKRGDSDSNSSQNVFYSIFTKNYGDSCTILIFLKLRREKTRNKYMKTVC